MLDKAAQSTQQSLEESAKLDRSGETMQCVRRHSLLSFRVEVANVAEIEMETFAAVPPKASPAHHRKRQFL